MMYGVIETGWQMATSAALDHAALKASRFGITGTNSPPRVRGAPTCRSASIPWFASAVTNGFLRTDRMTVTLTNFGSYAASMNPVGAALGAGTGGQVATYQLTYRQPYLLGGAVKLVAGTTEMTYRATITVRNEPFEDAVC